MVTLRALTGKSASLAGAFMFALALAAAVSLSSLPKHVFADQGACDAGQCQSGWNGDSPACYNDGDYAPGCGSICNGETGDWVPVHVKVYCL